MRGQKHTADDDDIDDSESDFNSRFAFKPPRPSIADITRHQLATPSRSVVEEFRHMNSSSTTTNAKRKYNTASSAAPPPATEATTDDKKDKSSSNCAPGSKGSGKSALKHILRERYPDAFLTSLPDNVLFGAEDGTHTIKSVSPENKYSRRPGDAAFKRASFLYYRVVAMADKLLCNTQLRTYYLAFDIPQFVPKNKAREQNERREGKDDGLDSKGTSKISWCGHGVYLRPDTLLDEWPRIHAHSGRAAFRQALSDVFCMLMSSYKPPAGKTLLVSGMLSHPSKEDPSRMTTCRKVYVLHTPFDSPEETHEDEFGQLVDADGNAVTNLPTGHVPYMDEIDRDLLETGITTNMAEIETMCKRTYMTRLHQHVRTHRACVPDLRITAGEGEVAVFYMTQLLAGNAVTCDDRGTDPARARRFLLDTIGAGDAIPWDTATMPGQNFVSHREAPGVVIRSEDTDIVCLGLAASYYLETKNEYGRRGGWHHLLRENVAADSQAPLGGSQQQGAGEAGVYWIDPSFKISIYLDFCARMVDEDELYHTIRRSLRISDEPNAIDRMEVAASNAAHSLMHKRGYTNRFGKTTMHTDDILLVSHVYTNLLRDLNPASSVPRHLATARFGCDGYLAAPIHAFIAAAKLHGDDYVYPVMDGIPMGWYTNAVFSWSTACNAIRISPRLYSNVRESEDTVREMIQGALEYAIDSAGYLNLIKGSAIHCYSRKKLIDPNATPYTVTLQQINDKIKTKPGYSRLPNVPFYAPKAMRLLWTILYNFLAQVSPEMVPSSLDMGWTLTDDHQQMPHMEPDSYDPAFLAKKAAIAEKAAARKKAKKDQANV